MPISSLILTQVFLQPESPSGSKVAPVFKRGGSKNSSMVALRLLCQGSGQNTKRQRDTLIDIRHFHSQSSSRHKTKVSSEHWRKLFMTTVQRDVHLLQHLDLPFFRFCTKCFTIHVHFYILTHIFIHQYQGSRRTQCLAQGPFKQASGAEDWTSDLWWKYDQIPQCCASLVTTHGVSQLSKLLWISVSNCDTVTVLLCQQQPRHTRISQKSDKAIISLIL